MQEIHEYSWLQTESEKSVVAKLSGFEKVNKSLIDLHLFLNLHASSQPSHNLLNLLKMARPIYKQEGPPSLYTKKALKDLKYTHDNRQAIKQGFWVAFGVAVGFVGLGFGLTFLSTNLGLACIGLGMLIGSVYAIYMMLATSEDLSIPSTVRLDLWKKVATVNNELLAYKNSNQHSYFKQVSSSKKRGSYDEEQSQYLLETTIA